MRSLANTQVSGIYFAGHQPSSLLDASFGLRELLCQILVHHAFKEAYFLNNTPVSTFLKKLLAVCKTTTEELTVIKNVMIIYRRLYNTKE